MATHGVTSAPSDATIYFDNLYTSTWGKKRLGYIDQTFAKSKNPLWFWLTKKGRMDTQVGGDFIKVDLEYGTIGSVKSIGRGGTLTRPDPQIMTTAYYQWKTVAGSMVHYQKDEQVNRGESAIYNMLKKKMGRLKKDMIEEYDSQGHGDGTGSDGLDIDGLDNLISATPTTGTVANINAANHSWWRNTYKAATGVSSEWLRRDMRYVYNTIYVTSGEFATFIYADQRAWEAYEDECLEYKMIVNKEWADAGFAALRFRNTDVVMGAANVQAMAGGTSYGIMFFINPEHLKLVYDPGFWFKMIPWHAIGQTLDRETAVSSTCDLVTGKRSAHGRLQVIPDNAVVA